MSQVERSEDFGELQRVVDYVYSNKQIASRLDVVIAADVLDLCDDLRGIIELLPPGNYTRVKLCNQLNSAIAGHVWGLIYGTVI